MGQRCPVCGQGNLYQLPAGVEVRIDGHALLSAMRYELEKLRCSACGAIFTAGLPAGMGDEKYSAQARAVLAVSRSYLGLPGYRVQAYQAMLGVPVPDATQWDQIEHVDNCAYTVFMQMEQVAAQGTLIFHDDTAVRILALMQENSDRLCQTGRHSAARVAHDDHRPPLCCTSSRPPGALRRLPMDITATLDHLGVTLQEYAGPDLMVRSPIDGAPMASLRCHTHAEVEACIAQAV